MPRPKPKPKLPSPSGLPPELIDAWTEKILRGGLPTEIGADFTGGPRDFMLTETLTEDMKEWGLVKDAADRRNKFHDLADGVRDFPSPHHEFWRGLSADEREDLRDFAVWRGLRRGGPRALALPEIQQHLTGLWAMIESAPEVSARVVAKERWKRIFTRAIPNLRKTKDRASPLRVKEAYDQALERLKGVRVRTRASLKDVQDALANKFPDWPQSLRTQLAHNLQAGDRKQVRDLVLKGVGQSFVREASTVEELVTLTNTLQRFRQQYGLPPIPRPPRP